MKRFFVITFLATLIAWYCFTAVHTALLHRQEGGPDTGTIAEAYTAIGYVFDGEAWTVFPLKVSGRQIKLITNVTIPASMRAKTDEAWWYSVRYQVRNHSGDVLADDTYVFKTTLTEYLDADTGTKAPAGMYINRDAVPADGRVALIPLSGFAGAAEIRFRSGDADPAIRDMVLRVYRREQTPERKIGYLWHRLNERERVRLARGNVYPPDLLREQEKQNMLRFLWRPLGPLGVEGVDYRIRRLYIREREDRQRIEENILPYGLPVDTHCRAIVPIPSQGGRIRLAGTMVGNASGQPVRPFSIRWVGLTAGEREEHRVIPDGTDFHYETCFPGGLIEIDARSTMVVRAFLLADKTSWVEITPEPLYVRTYVTEKQAALEYELTHVCDQPVPLRMDIRTIFNAGDETVRRSVTYELIDNDGRIPCSGELAADPVRSVYERMPDAAATTYVTDPSTYYFAVSSSVTKIRLRADNPMLISAYTRPYGLIKTTHVPDDYFAYREDDGNGQPTWFYKNPEDAERLFMQGRSVLLQVQPRPGDTGHDLLAGDYYWEDFVPEGAWKARYLLVPRRSEIPVRPESAGAVFCSLPGNREKSVTLVTVDGVAHVEPTVLIMRTRSEPETINLVVDKSRMVPMPVAGSFAEWLLPPLKVGEHALIMRSGQDVRCYVNHCTEAKDLFVKRMAHCFEKAGVSFVCEKKGWEKEVLAVRLYGSACSATETEVAVAIAAEERVRVQDRPLKDWTVFRRRFVVRHREKERIPVLQTRNEYVYGERIFFVPLGSDVPPGNYAVTCLPERGPGGYILMSRTTTGRFESRMVHRNPYTGDR